MNVRIVRTCLGINHIISSFKLTNKKIGFVPTMGALHEGHTSLFSKARDKCDVLVASIYANPTQFDNKEDLKKYPRTISADLAIMEREGVDIAFLCQTDDIYYNLEVSKVDYGTLTNSLEGAHRKGHFDGMTTIVRRLFDVVQPDIACFGEKDFQQLAIIKEMVTIESMNVEIVGCPIIREKDGLAMSSRNIRLSPSERKNALTLSRSLGIARKMKEENHRPEEIQKEIFRQLNENGLNPDYVKIVKERSLELAAIFDNKHKFRILIAAYSGKTRLIDNGAL